MDRWTEMGRQIDWHLISLRSFYSFVHKEIDESEFWYTPVYSQHWENWGRRMKSSSQYELPRLCIKKNQNNNNNKGNMMLVWKSIPPSPQYIYIMDQEILIRVMKALVLPWPYLERRKVTGEDKRASPLLCLNNSEILSWPSILSKSSSAQISSF